MKVNDTRRLRHADRLLKRPISLVTKPVTQYQMYIVRIPRVEVGGGGGELFKFPA